MATEDDLPLLGSLLKIAGQQGLLTGLLSIPLIATAGMVAPYGITFYLLWKKFLRHRSLDKLNPEDISKEQVHLKLELDSLKAEYNHQQTRKQLLEEKREKAEAIDRADIERSIEAAQREMASLESGVEVNLDRAEFLHHLNLLLKQKTILKEKGLWSRLDTLSKKDIKNLDELLDKESLNHTKMKDYLKKLNTNQNFYTSIFKES